MMRLGGQRVHPAIGEGGFDLTDAIVFRIAHVAAVGPRCSPRALRRDPKVGVHTRELRVMATFVLREGLVAVLAGRRRRGTVRGRESLRAWPL